MGSRAQRLLLSRGPAAIIRQPYPELGEHVKAIVRVGPGSNLDDADVKRHAAHPSRGAWGGGGAVR